MSLATRSEPEYELSAEIAEVTRSHPSPLISVIIPAYDSERFLEATVDSVRSQTFHNWEMIIVDDGATDGTGQLAERLAAADGRIRVVHQSNRGLPNARNSGADRAHPDSTYITFIDADDLWMPYTLATLLDALERHPDWAGVHGVGQYIDGSDRMVNEGVLENWCRSRLQVSEGLDRRVMNPTSAPTTFAMLALRNYIPTGTILLRRDEFEIVGRFNDTLQSMEDWHLWVRISLRKKIGFVDRIVFRYRRHDRNMSSDRWRMRREQFRAAADLYETLNLTDSERKLFLRSQPIACHLYWTCDHIKHGRLRSAAFHLGIATRNLLDYHIAPKLLRRSQV